MENVERPREAAVNSSDPAEISGPSETTPEDARSTAREPTAAGARERGSADGESAG